MRIEPNGRVGTKVYQSARSANVRDVAELAKSVEATSAQPKDDQPKDDQPKKAQPKADQSNDDQPKAQPKAQPKDDQSKEDPPKDDQPNDDQPKDDQPNDDQPKDDEAKDADNTKKRERESTHDLASFVQSINADSNLLDFDGMDADELKGLTKQTLEQVGYSTQQAEKILVKISEILENSTAE